MLKPKSSLKKICAAAGMPAVSASTTSGGLPVVRAFSISNFPQMALILAENNLRPVPGTGSVKSADNLWNA